MDLFTLELDAICDYRIIWFNSLIADYFTVAFRYFDMNSFIWKYYGTKKGSFEFWILVRLNNWKTSFLESLLCPVVKTVQEAICRLIRSIDTLRSVNEQFLLEVKQETKNQKFQHMWVDIEEFSEAKKQI